VIFRRTCPQITNEGALWDESEQLYPLIGGRSKLSSLEWGFPKGRRSSTESELACALRETYEEAGVRKQDLRILDGPPLMEEYRGSNGISYRHRYWLAEAPTDLEVRMDSSNIDQRREISDVRWCSMAEAMSLIRPYNKEKKSVLEAGALRVSKMILPS
jgi:8-oxo-dGTP pyrophosphatase MutT (NUDIX family)